VWSAMAGLGMLLAAGCAPAHDNPDKPAPTRYKVSTEDYLPGVAADTVVPSVQRAPVVVLIPGGGWQTADRAGLEPLADALAAHGIVAVNATYRASEDGVRFPVPVADVVCAVDYAVARTRRAGITPTHVVVLGHSAGGHLAALAALRGPHFRSNCPYPPATVDGLIGLAGAYDVFQLRDVARSLFGVSAGEDQKLWRDGDPMEWASLRPELPALLAHGTDDDMSETFTTRFAAALERGGHHVRTELVQGATHQTIYTRQVIGDLVIGWVRALR
jgi:acetyl esterase/lipase